MTEEPTNDAGQGLWQVCVEQLGQEMPEQQFNTWIKPLTAHVAEDFSKVTVYVANRFKLDWIRAQYAGRISAMLESLYGQPVTLELALAQRESVVRTYVRPSSSERSAPPETIVTSVPTVTSEDAAAPVFRTRLNAALTFETLVEGTANRMARSAAMHVAGSPGHLYNPLFIYGGVGLGKTHLVHAVGNKLLADKPDAKVLYIHAEQFVSDVVKAYQRRTFDEFKERYHSLDLLLIDDVQFFANKDRTQEEFFNAFEALLAKKSHIVMTSDTYPKGLANIAETKLKATDVITRAAAADILAELPPSAQTTKALSDALTSTATDKQNDAALSIVGALEKVKDAEATAALLEAAKSPDHLVRRRAIDALKGREGVTVPSVGFVKSRNTHEDYVRAVGRIGKQSKAMLTTDKGVITIQFYPAEAPLTVDSFIQLAKAHFFDGLTFHRVVPNFVIQGGDPRGDGNGGPGYTIRCEINTVPYDTGAVGMALSGKDTGGSQFFITHSPQPHLDGGYTVFAHVIAGQDVVDKIERGDRIRTVTIEE